MKLKFENPDLAKTIKEVIRGLIKNNRTSNGNVSIENIPLDEIDCYEHSLPQKSLKNADEVYAISQCVCGAWDQPLGMVVVSY